MVIVSVPSHRVHEQPLNRFPAAAPTPQRTHRPPPPMQCCIGNSLSRRKYPPGSLTWATLLGSGEGGWLSHFAYLKHFAELTTIFQWANLYIYIGWRAGNPLGGDLQWIFKKLPTQISGYVYIVCRVWVVHRVCIGDHIGRIPSESTYINKLANKMARITGARPGIQYLFIWSLSLKIFHLWTGCYVAYI